MCLSVRMFIFREISMLVRWFQTITNNHKILNLCWKNRHASHWINNYFETNIGFCCCIEPNKNGDSKFIFNLVKVCMQHQTLSLFLYLLKSTQYIQDSGCGFTIKYKGWYHKYKGTTIIVERLESFPDVERSVEGWYTHRQRLHTLENGQFVLPPSGSEVNFLCHSIKVCTEILNNSFLVANERNKFIKVNSSLRVHVA